MKSSYIRFTCIKTFETFNRLENLCYCVTASITTTLHAGNIYTGTPFQELMSATKQREGVSNFHALVDPILCQI